MSFLDISNVLATHGRWLAIAAAAVTLAISVWILSRLRWSQSRPLRICIVLSTMAHILLLATADFTHLWDAPPAAAEDIIHLRLAEQAAPHDRSRAGVSPWNQLADERPATPDLPALPLPHATDRQRSTKEIPLLASSAVADARGQAASDVLFPQPSQADWPADQVQPLAAAPMEPEVVCRSIDGPPQVVRETNTSSSRKDATIKAESARELHPVPSAPFRTSVREAATDSLSTPQPTAAAARQSAEPSGKWTNGGPVPKRYQSRFVKDRQEVLLRRGGSGRTEAAVQQALQWLVTNQQPDGRWDPRQHGAGRGQLVEGQFRGSAGAQADTGISGLGLLALMAAGHTHRSGAHHVAVQRGLEFLLRNQRRDGNLGGAANGYARMYCHGIAALAVSEAYALTGDTRLRPFVERAVQCTIRSQHPVTGGWRYYPGDEGDTSQFGWQVMALVSAQQAGVAIPPATQHGMEAFLTRVAAGSHGGLASYRPGLPPTPSMTAEALVCRQFLATGDAATADQEAAQYLMQELPGRGRDNFYYWYYATLGLSHLDGPSWQKWNAALKQHLLVTQRRNGRLQGSWDPNCVWGGHGGRVYATAMAALCLEVYYRYE